MLQKHDLKTNINAPIFSFCIFKATLALWY